MASLQKRGDKWQIQFPGSDGKRQTLRIGKQTKRAAESICSHVEGLIASKMSGAPLSRDDAGWTGKISDQLAARLAKIGLIPSRQNITLTEAFEIVIQGRKDVKPATVAVWRQGQRSAYEYFGEKKPIAKITRANAEDYKQHLIGSGLGNGTIRKRLQTINMVFNQMVSREAIEKNSFSGISVTATVDQSRNAFIPREDVYRVLEQAPDAEWRCIIALSRFAGLRCPSEVLSLKWENILWDRAEIIVVSPKTARHAEGGQRTIPLFPDIEGPLRDAFEQAEPGSVYVITKHRGQGEGKYGWANANFRTSLAKMIQRAGLRLWPKPFHGMRASFATELVEKTSIQTAAAILGHSPAVAVKHYLRVRPEDYEKARTASFQEVAKSDAFGLQNPTTRAHALSSGQPQEMTQAPAWQEPTRNIATSCGTGQNARVELDGLEPTTPALQTRCSPN